MPFKPIRSQDSYIQLKKKITNKALIKVVRQVAQDMLLTEVEVCYKFITDSAVAEIKKREKFIELKKGLNDYAQKPQPND